ncbi:hypothetical protein [Micromonospora parathelypteridis]|uniref:Uncharacterized protein n=1 Tax=Micromonospora parathelypteridis TaxID=1839617 RepID=A0A840VHU4_9ACTN|nr:hypothetical protein [Micromonospora parathelypteridis]MBB5476205.1 hypothetical protein [Micromonospora parathelypteridis]GGO13960.1 hypothetical protein GCM10011576_24450 [Micromonospora parathelypteridis]
MAELDELLEAPRPVQKYGHIAAASHMKAARNIHCHPIGTAPTLNEQGRPDQPKEFPVLQYAYTETTRFMPRSGGVLPSIGRTHDLCVSEQNWKPGWRRE